MTERELRVFEAFRHADKDNRAALSPMLSVLPQEMDDLAAFTHALGDGDDSQNP